MTTQAERLIECLWPQGAASGQEVFAVLDGARSRRIAPWIRLRTLEYECLFRGDLSPRLSDAAPYVVHLKRDDGFTSELLERAWSRAWGIFTRVPDGVSLERHRRHLRTLLRVKDESGRKLVFRFYDPRVLRVYLPTCTGDEAQTFFGPLPEILAESEDGGSLLSYRPARDGVTMQRVAV